MDDIKPDISAATVAAKVHFSELCGLLEKISKTQGNDKKKRILKEFIDQWRKSHNVVHGSEKPTVSMIYLTEHYAEKLLFLVLF